jgi:hypothetical protein
MRLPWDRRGLVDYQQMPNMKPATIARLSDRDLYQLLADHASNSSTHIAGQAELRRRENRTARLALWIAFGSLVVSIVGLWLHSA